MKDVSSFDNAWGGVWIQSRIPQTKVEVRTSSFVQNGIVGMYASGLELTIADSFFVQNQHVNVDIDGGPQIDRSGDGLVLANSPYVNISGTTFYDNQRFGAIHVNPTLTSMSENVWAKNQGNGRVSAYAVVGGTSNSQWTGGDSSSLAANEGLADVDDKTMDTETLIGAPVEP